MTDLPDCPLCKDGFTNVGGLMRHNAPESLDEIVCTLDEVLCSPDQYKELVALLQDGMKWRKMKNLTVDEVTQRKQND